MATSQEEMIQAIEGMTVLELSELVKALEERFGVSAAAPVAAAGAGVGGPAAPTEVVEEQTEFDVVLTGIGANKIAVIKAVRDLTPLGLKEAKDLVESAPAPILQAVPREEATKAQTHLQAAGATADVK